jgi:hypothetical protein
MDLQALKLHQADIHLPAEETAKIGAESSLLDLKERRDVRAALMSKYDTVHLDPDPREDSEMKVCYFDRAFESFGKVCLGALASAVAQPGRHNRYGNDP